MENSGKLSAALEAFLFMYGEPADVARIARALNADADAVQAAAEELGKALDAEERGVRLVRDGGRVQLATKPAFAGLIAALIKDELREELTPAALETLSVISYAGPLPRSEVEYVRGVQSSFTLRTLLLRGLIERSLDPERPHTYLYQPSFELLRHLGVPSVEALPDYAGMRAVMKKFREPHTPPAIS